MSRLNHKASLALLCLALAGSSAASASSDLPDWTPEQLQGAAKTLSPYVNGRAMPALPGVSSDAARKFWAASSVLTRGGTYPRIGLMAYDYVTRCAYSVEFDVTQGIAAADGGTLVRWSRAGADIAVPAMARDGLGAVQAFSLAETPDAASDCAGRINSVYGAAPARGASKLAEHAALVLRGGPAGSKEAPLTAPAIKRTVMARIVASDDIERPELLAAVADQAVTVIILGDPAGETRFAAQYRNLPDGKWQFEGASSLGLALLKELEMEQ